MKKKNDIPSGFEDVLNSVYGNAEEGEGITNIDDMVEKETLEEITNQEPPVSEDPEDGNKGGSDDPNAHEDHTEEPPAQVTNPEPPVSEPPVEDPATNTEPTEDDVTEA